MYTPPAFRQDDQAALADFMQAHPFATLVIAGDDGLEATHAPLLVDTAADGSLLLTGHLARPNPLAAAGAQALAIFHGPHGYVSPSWYPSKAEAGKAVPTWNYVAVHAEGVLERIDDPAELRAIVARLSDRFEAGRPEPWSVADAPAEYIEAMLRAIIGFRLRVSKLTGKWKLSQNRSAEDRAGVIDGLRRDGVMALAAMMQALE